MSTQETNDKQQMSPALEALAALPGQLGKVDNHNSRLRLLQRNQNVKDCEAKGDSAIYSNRTVRVFITRPVWSDSENPSVAGQCRCSGENEAID